MADPWRMAWRAESLPRGRRVLYGTASLLVAAAVWLPCVHRLYAPRPGDGPNAPGVGPTARALARRHLDLWTEPDLKAAEIARMRASCAEWDFMGRTFLALALANMACREPADRDACLGVMDRIIDESLRLEEQKGLYFFLMPYAHDRPWVARPPRSLFIDGEIALMLGVRLVVADRADYRPLFARRVDVILDSMRRGPVLCAESYPDECWTFCNTAALAAVRISDALRGEDHSEFFRDWLRAAKAHLTEPRTGLLVSAFTYHGQTLHGPEGSSIWMASHCLLLIDEPFARDQYRRARKELGRSFLGFGYAREWPPSWPEPFADVDSGPVVPLLEASASSSGLALLGSAAFGDADFYSRLRASLDFGGFPIRRGGSLRYCASNQVGDAVALYSMVLGPIWRIVKERPSP